MEPTVRHSSVMVADVAGQHDEEREMEPGNTGAVLWKMVILGLGSVCVSSCSLERSE